MDTAKLIAIKNELLNALVKPVLLHSIYAKFGDWNYHHKTNFDRSIIEQVHITF